MSKITDYFKETYAEFKHVKWPTRRQAIIFTVIVIIIALGIAYYLGAFDLIFSKILDLVV